MKAQNDLVVLESNRESVNVRVASDAEITWFDGLLDDKHYLGAGRPVGDYLHRWVPSF